MQRRKTVTDSSDNTTKGPIAWMARNRVAANLAMLMFLIGGAILAFQVKQEIFPEFQLDIISISVDYPGASPEEVEQGIVLAIEDEVRGIDGVKEVRSTSLENRGTVTIELLTGTNRYKALQEAKNAVDQIQSFPEEAERPTVRLIEARNQVISLIISGDLSERSLGTLAEDIRSDLLQMEDITIVDLSTERPLRISVEIPQNVLREYGLTLEQVARVINQSSLDLPAGEINTTSGEILLRTKERRDWAKEFSSISIISRPDGSRVRLGEIAQLKETYGGDEFFATFNGQPAQRIDVYRIGNQKPTEIAARVGEYAKKLDQKLPDTVHITIWDDFSILFADRMALLAKNAMLGLVLVLLLLGIFLDPRLAFWVTMGIPISIVGSFLFLPLTGATLNMVSLFAFIITLGIVVDDAVVVGEIIHQKREEGMGYLESAIVGAKEIATPVTFAVLTNIAAFAPLFFIPGTSGKIFLQIPAVVVTVFVISLIESLFILPAHLSHPREKIGIWQWLNQKRQRFDHKLSSFIRSVYLPLLDIALRFHYATLAIGLALLFISVGALIGGHIPFSYLPKIDSDIVTVQATLPAGSPISHSRQISDHLVNSAKKILEEQGDIALGIYSQVGKPLPKGGPVPEGSASGSQIIGTQISLIPANKRTITGKGVADLWREKVGEIPGLESLTFNASIHAGGGEPIDIRLQHKSTHTLEKAAKDLAKKIKNYTGVTDIKSGTSLGKPQLTYTLTPQGRSLGITAKELANQLRNSFYGAEAVRQQRGRNEVRTLVRLTSEERSNLYTIENFILQTPTGGEIPLQEAAEIQYGRAYTEIRHNDGQRVIGVTADVDESLANANKVIADIQETVLPSLLKDYPGLSYTFAGQQKEQREALSAMATGSCIALLAIYALLAIPFQSYLQPVIVMISIPFGVIGAILGHFLLGYELSIISVMGIIALSGVVVNDSLVLVVTANRLRKTEHLSATKALLQAAKLRFRPIMLTSLTTFFGLSPMILETSMQARFLIPMAISLGFGILFATQIILFICPASYLIVEDFRSSSSH